MKRESGATHGRHDLDGLDLDARAVTRLRVLNAIRDAGDASRTDIAAALKLSPATVTFVTSGLMAGGLIEEVSGQELNIRDMSGDRTLVRFGTGDEITVQAGPDGVRFLLISGAPIEEPVAWHGPIVMNTKDELRQAMRDLQNGTFIKPAH